MTSNVRRDVTSEMNKYDATNESETEDEEVRINCMAGLRGVEDSDMNTTENSDYEEEDDDDIVTDDEMSRDGFRIANFVSNPCRSIIPLVCPKPKAPALTVKRLSPLEEHDDDEPEPESVVDRSTVEVQSNSYDSVETNSKSDFTCVETSNVDEQSHNSIKDTLVESQSDSRSHSDTELTEIMASIGDALEMALDESESSSSRLYYLGVMNDIDTATATPVVRKPKRALCQSDGLVDHISEEYKKARTMLKDVPTFIVPMSLLQSFTIQQTDSYSINCLNTVSNFAIKLRDESPVLLSSDDDDDDDLDRQLGEELGDEYHGEGQETPVPLLTPPGSPLTVEWEGAATTLCEWPSNLIVDSAMQAVNELRPMSPTSLENLERDEHDRIFAFPSGDGNEKRITTTSSTCSNNTLFSPLFKSVYA